MKKGKEDIMMQTIKARDIKEKWKNSKLSLGRTWKNKLTGTETNSKKKEIESREVRNSIQNCSKDMIN